MAATRTGGREVLFGEGVQGVGGQLTRQLAAHRLQEARQRRGCQRVRLPHHARLSRVA